MGIPRKVALYLGGPGPAQSDELVHFCGRRSGTYGHLRSEIQELSPQQRLSRILADGGLEPTFKARGAEVSVVCFSESPPSHLHYLIKDRGYSPWGVVVTRKSVFERGGGAVAYLHHEDAEEFPAGLRHWVCEIGKSDGGFVDWTHEREWRLPDRDEDADGVLRGVAVLIGDEAWEPDPIASPDGIGGTVPPQRWLQAPRWLWTGDAIEKLPPVNE